jgi:hypothetical protein
MAVIPDSEDKEAFEDALEERLKGVHEHEKRFHIFAHRVAERAQLRHGKRRSGVFTFGMISQVLLITIILVRLTTLLLERLELTDFKRWHVGSCNQVRSWCGGKPLLSLSDTWTCADMFPIGVRYARSK